MTFPVVAATNHSVTASASTSHTVNLPADIVAGNLLLIFFSCNSTPTVTFPEGWTEIFEEASSTYNTLAIAWRKADGEEGASITVETSIAQQAAHISFRITGAADPTTRAPEVSAEAEGTGTAPDPASLTPTSGAKDYLWIAVEGNDDDDAITGYPTSYDDNQETYVSASGAGTCGIAIATRDLNASSADPGAFTLAATEEWVAATVAVHPITFVLHEWEGSDGIALTDTLVKTPMKMLVDGFQFSDVTIKEFYKVLTDPIAFTDTLVKVHTYIRTFVDGIAFTDVVHRLFDKVFSDGIAFTDCLTRWRWVTAIRNLTKRRCPKPSVREQDVVDDGNI